MTGFSTCAASSPIFGSWISPEILAPRDLWQDPLQPAPISGFDRALVRLCVRPIRATARLPKLDSFAATTPKQDPGPLCARRVKQACLSCWWAGGNGNVARNSLFPPQNTRWHAPAHQTAVSLSHPTDRQPNVRNGQGITVVAKLAKSFPLSRDSESLGDFR